MQSELKMTVWNASNNTIKYCDSSLVTRGTCPQPIVAKAADVGPQYHTSDDSDSCDDNDSTTVESSSSMCSDKRQADPDCASVTSLKRPTSAVEVDLPFSIAIPPREKYERVPRKYKKREKSGEKTKYVPKAKVLYEFDRPCSKIKKRRCSKSTWSARSIVQSRGILRTKESSCRMRNIRKSVSFALPDMSHNEMNISSLYRESNEESVRSKEPHVFHSLHEDCVKAIFSIGLQNCSPKLLLELMPNPSGLDLESIQRYMEINHPNYRAMTNIGHDDGQQQQGVTIEHALVLPTLSDEEKKSSIGASYMFLVHLYHTLNIELKAKREQREIDAAVGMVQLTK